MWRELQAQTAALAGQSGSVQIAAEETLPTGITRLHNHSHGRAHRSLQVERASQSFGDRSETQHETLATKKSRRQHRITSHKHETLKPTHGHWVHSSTAPAPHKSARANSSSRTQKLGNKHKTVVNTYFVAQTKKKRYFAAFGGLIAGRLNAVSVLNGYFDQRDESKRLKRK